MDKWDKYLHICRLAQKKYFGYSGFVVLEYRGQPTRYKRVCEFAFKYFLDR